MEEKSKKITIGHFYGADRDIVAKTGYSHGQQLDKPVGRVMSKILKAGLNIQVKHYLGGFVVYISKDGFHQR